MLIGVFLILLRSIPLVPRRPKSGEPGTGRGKDKKGDKKKGQAADPDKPETPVPPSDPDEKVSGQLTFFYRVTAFPGLITGSN